MTPTNKESVREMDKLFDEYYPIGTVKADDNIDAAKAEVMTKIMEHRRNQFKSKIQAELDKAVIAGRVDLETKLNQLYTETEEAKPPQTFNRSEQSWNDGFYKGQLKALEVTSLKLFNKDGDTLKAQIVSKEEK